MRPSKPTPGELGDVNEATKYLASLRAWEAERDARIKSQAAARSALDDATERATSLTGWVAALQSVLQDTTKNAAIVTKNDAVISSTSATIATLSAAISDTAQAHEIATARLLDAPASGVPLVLLPLRLEAHWDPGVLHVRIYPDVVSVDCHQPALTPGEQTTGAAFWQLRTRNGVPQTDVDQAWEQLARGVGPQRAAWIVRASDPNGAASTTRATSFDLAMAARLLPDRFAVVALSGGDPINMSAGTAPPSYVTWTAAVPDPLPIGMLDAPGTSSWMTDLAAAKAAGMAVSIDVPAGAPAIDALLVVGVRGADSPDLAGLLTAHAYTDGAEVLVDGVASNNSSQITAAHSRGRDSDVARELIEPAPAAAPPDGAAGAQLADALGVPRAALTRIAGAHAPRDAAAAAMRLIVGDGSNGELSTLLGGGAPWTLVSPSGPSPAVRLGRQPYGVLPVTAPVRWQALPSETGAPLQTRLAEWGQSVGPTACIDPLSPPLHLGTGPARRITHTDDGQLAELLVEAASSLSYRSGGDSFAGSDALVGPVDGDQAPSAVLRRIAATSPPSLPSIVPPLPSTLLARIAVAAKQHAAALPGSLSFAEVAKTDAALGELAERAAAPSGRDDLVRLLTDTLDAASHRFDAWLTGVVSERLLVQRRAASTNGVGAYGWLTDVQQRGDVQSHGHVLAPSLGHAATAAVLRSGFLGQRRQAWALRVRSTQAHLASADNHVQATPASTQQAMTDLHAATSALARAQEGLAALPPLDTTTEADLPLAIDLSSQRVRAGRRTLRAVRAGQPLAAVLGYQFERDLISAGKPEYLAAFRKLSRFHTGTALEALEEARRTAQQTLSVARSQLAHLQAVTAQADDVLTTATDALNAAVTSQTHTHSAAAQLHALENERASMDIIGDTARIKELGPRPIPIVRHAALDIPVVHAGKVTGTTPYDLTSTDADNPATATAWQQNYTRLTRVLERDQARISQISAALQSPTSLALLNAEADADRAVASAQAAVNAVQAKRDDAATAAARFATSDVAHAQAALDLATHAISDALAALLASAQTTTALTATVDGIALRARYQAALAVSPPLFDHTTIPFPASSSVATVDPELTFPAVGEPDYTALRVVLDQLDAHVDAVADLITAESVHQLVQGNPVRSGAALDVAATGSVPDDLDVIRTPRPGHDTTHRLLVGIDPKLLPAWSVAEADAASHADPVLAAWISHHIPDPAGAQVNVKRVDPSSGQEDAPIVVSAAQITLDPLAWIRMSADPAELEQRIAHAARTEWASSLGPAAASGRVLIDAKEGPFPDLVAAAAAMRGLLGTSRALMAADLALPPATGPAASAAAVAAVLGRVRDVETLVAARTDALEKAAASADANALLDALFAASGLGEANATPQMVESIPDIDTLQLQAANAVARLHQRISTPFADETNDPAGTLTRARARLGTLCAMRLPVLADVAVPGDAHFGDDLALVPGRLVNAAPADLRHWLMARARVRPAVETFLTGYDVVEALAPGAARMDLRASQLPDGINTASWWAGAEGAPPQGGVSIVMQRSFPDPLPAVIVGLFVDGWTEVVSIETHAPAVAFHYDQPDSTPPQAILVAVAPDMTAGRLPATWDLDTLLDTLTSTLSLAQDRAVAAEFQNVAGVTIAEQP